MPPDLYKLLIIFGFNFCASSYIGIGVYGIMFLLAPAAGRLDSFSIWHSLGFGLAALLLIHGICYFGRLWDRILVRENRERERKEKKEDRDKTPPGKAAR